MARVKYISCDIYKRGVHVFIGTHKQMMKYAKKEWVEEEYKDFLETLSRETDGYATTYYGDGECLVLLPKLPNNPVDISVAAHELLHAADYILWYSGVYRYGKNEISNEAYTYLLEHLMRNVLEKEGYETIKSS